jgi:acetoin utilization deacetylase AcuC-like enzyme
VKAHERDRNSAHSSLMIRVYWSRDYVVAREDFDTTRKSAWIIDSLTAEPIAGLQITAPELLAATDLAEVHDSGYIEAVRTGKPLALAESQGFRWDQGLWTMACAHTSGMVAAAKHALEYGCTTGSLSSGQHHAKYTFGDGFCTFNGIALAAKRALRVGAKKVLIIDTDAHCGGGTHSLIEKDDRIWQLDVAVNPYDRYSPRPLNTLDHVRSAKAYLGTLCGRLASLAKSHEPFDLCIYYAGMDPYERCHIGGLMGIDRPLLAERERLVFAWCAEQRIPVAFGIAGGYVNAGFQRAELVNLHKMTLSSAIACRTLPSG